VSEILTQQILMQASKKLLEVLSKYDDFQNPRINNSPRAIGDTVQSIIGEVLPDCFPKGSIKDFQSDFNRKALQDVAFSDTQGNYYAIDVKTHALSTKFNMPNLVSVKRLAEIFELIKNNLTNI